MTTQPRRGAARRSDISADTLAQLNSGTLATATLAEGLAIDFRQLLHGVAPEIDGSCIDPTAGVTRRMQQAGEALLTQYGTAAIRRFAAHPADTVRGWAAYMIAAVDDWTPQEYLAQIRPLADDPHFAVREWAWLALRPRLTIHLEAMLGLLEQWSYADSAYIRRFASEYTRPRGVWCAHIAELKAHPQRGLPILQPLRADPARYVQDSVANWLNDAAKSQPTWVKAVCAEWLAEHDSPATKYICKRALRSL